MKNSRKIIILMMAITMLFALSVIASAAPEITVGDATVTQGTGDQIVNLSLTMDGNDDPGIYDMLFKIDFPDDSITWTAVELLDEGPFAEFDDTAPQNFISGVKFGYDGDTTKGNGAFANLVFTVPTDTAVTYEVTVISLITDDDDEEYENTSTGTITVEAAEPAATLTAIGKNLVLDGGINAKVKFEYTGTETLYINGNAVEKAADGYYYAEIAKSAKDYADEVTFTATASDVDAVVVPTSVAAIIDEYQATQSDAELLALVDAAETYCSYAATYFADGTVPTVDVTVPDYKSDSSFIGTQDGITLNSVSLILRDKVALRVYFNVATGAELPDGLTALDGDNTHAYYEKANIAVADLATAVEDTVGGIQISVIPLAYANLDIDENTANLVKALYNYYLAADAYTPAA